MYNDYNEELYHYGVKGMKWGVRRAVNTPYGEKKSAYKQAKKDYNKAFNKAYGYTSNHRLGTKISKKMKAEEVRRWDDTNRKYDKMVKAKTDYKQAKQERNQQIKSVHKEINKNATLADKLTYNDNTRKKAAKYVVDRNMSVADATKKANRDAVRNTALVLGAYGAVAVATLYKK